jgi:hypothetical protein
MSQQNKIYGSRTVNEVQNTTWSVAEGVWCDENQRFATWIVYSVEFGFTIGEFKSKRIANHVARIHNKQHNKQTTNKQGE